MLMHVDPQALAVFNHKGKLLFGNRPFANMLGYEVSIMAGMNISSFMEQPYGQLHQRWLKVS
jgi:PAS domain S-box-containing protein